MDRAGADSPGLWKFIQPLLVQAIRDPLDTARFPVLSRAQILAYLGNFYAQPQWLHNKVLELLSYELTEKGAMLRTLTPGSDEVLTNFLRLWSEAQQIRKSFTNFFHFLNIGYLSAQHKFLIGDDVEVTFRDACLRPNVECIQASLLRIINDDRLGRPAQLNLVKETVKALLRLGFLPPPPPVPKGAGGVTGPLLPDRTASEYVSVFQTAFLKTTETFFLAESKEVLSQNGPLEYALYVERRVLEEEKRCRESLAEWTLKDLQELLKIVLIQSHTESFQQVFKECLDAEQQAEMKALYTLLERVKDGTEKLVEPLAEHIIARGQLSADGLSERDLPGAYIRHVLATYETYGRLVKEGFHGDAGFELGLAKGIRSILENNEAFEGQSVQFLAPRLLAKYCDSLLREEGEVAVAQLANIVAIFPYLPEKDVFQHLHVTARPNPQAKLLLERVTKGTCHVAREREFLLSLKALMGDLFSAPALQTLRDYEISQQVNRAAAPALKPLGVQLQAFVTVRPTWRPAVDLSFRLPPSMAIVLDAFALAAAPFYPRDKGRFVWLHDLGRLQVLDVLAPAKARLQVSSYQAALLQYFDKSDTVPAAALAELGLAPDQLKTALHGLLQTQVLLGSVEGEWAATSFSVNLGRRVDKKVLNCVVAAPADRDKETLLAVMNERWKGHRIQACIVRTLKAVHSEPSKRVMPWAILSDVVRAGVEKWLVASEADLKAALLALLEAKQIVAERTEAHEVAGYAYLP